MTNQNAIGNIVIDSISTLSMNLKENSYYEGTINGDSSNSNINFNGYKLYVNEKSIN